MKNWVRVPQSKWGKNDTVVVIIAVTCVFITISSVAISYLFDKS